MKIFTYTSFALLLAAGGVSAATLDHTAPVSVSPTFDGRFVSGAEGTQGGTLDRLPISHGSVAAESVNQGDRTNTEVAAARLWR